jgi:tripartite-type tricarboxylate transporter receptor subunit TctC
MAGISRTAALLAVAGLATAGCAEMPKSDVGYYPSGIVRIVTPFAAGGISDTTARVAAKCLEDELGCDVHCREPGRWWRSDRDDAVERCSSPPFASPC